MKILKYIILLCLVSCDFGLSEELNKSKAEELILSHKNTGVIDRILITESNVHSVVEKNGIYLFVVNSFNGDFNGYVYSEEKLDNFDTLKFNHFYNLHSEKSEGKWTKVDGKW